MINHELHARLFSYAEKLGSSAKTLRGVCRFLAACPRTQNRVILAMNPYRERAKWTPRAKRWTAEERDTRRALNDAKFRRSLVKRLRKQLARTDYKPSNVPEIDALCARLTRITRKPVAPYSVLDACPEIAEIVGWDRRGKDATYTSGVAFSVDATPGVTTWKNGTPRSYTRAERTTTLQIVAFQRPAGAQLFVEGTKRRVAVTLPHPVSTLATDGLIPGTVVAGTLTDGSRVLYAPTGARKAVAIPMPAELIKRYGAWEHGATIEACHAEIARKRVIARDAAKHARASRRDDRAARLLSRSRNLTATFADARAVGYCATGITGWAESRGLPLDAQVPLRRLARDKDDRAQKLALGIAARVWSEHRSAKQQHAA